MGAGLTLVKQTGKVKCLRDKIEALEENLDFGRELDIHVGIAHTRWATHGVPSDINSHPQRSDNDNEFIVVHNGEFEDGGVELRSYKPLLKKGKVI